MDQIISTDYASAAGSNTIYNRHRARWAFLLDSYMGGMQYQNGSYLTRYQLETEAEYAARLQITPLDNQVRSIIATYISFLFRVNPTRDLGSLESEITVGDFLKDCDWEGRDLDAFMKQAAIYANIFGHTWIVMSKPDVGAITRADEIAAGVRPYLNMMTPLVVTDWKWTRKLNGSYELSYLKYVEDSNGSVSVIKEWTPTTVVTTTVNHEGETITDRLEELNGLGRVPAVCLYAHTSSVRGLGLSTVNDIADTQRLIYNLTSEAEQGIRLGSHPSLVATADTNVGSGAGALIHMPQNLDPALKPYVLEFTGQEVSSVYTAITNLVSSIDKMANTGSIRATESQVMSGVSREVEFQLLNARLSEQADNIELAEEQLWKLFAEYQGQIWTGEIKYPDSFAVRDTDNELDQKLRAYGTVATPAFRTAIEHEIAELLDLDLEETVVAELEAHPVTTVSDRSAHIQTMIMEGYTDAEILVIHAEISQADITAAKQDLLNLSNNGTNAADQD
ncbi:hypothetical protein [Brevundimonas sp.]|jgi:hypothetical protein|uniref:hypothetical protein n=1 Tax=Brevundimonas sp. TaxID=1871086 RepID=UPI003782EBFB